MTFSEESCKTWRNVYYKIADAIASQNPGERPFIIANENRTGTGRIGRYYTIFPDFQDFLKRRGRFPHCHELLVNHEKQADEMIGGRLVFDFDIKMDYSLPKAFKRHIEDLIIKVIEDNFHDVDVSLFEFVWSSSANPSKHSKHLTVKNLYFADWMELSRIFYKLFADAWDQAYDWISSEKLVDLQIIRRNGSLRMVGSSKIGGYQLIMDDNKFSLQDSLIRIYDDSEEQIVSLDNLNYNVLEREFTMFSDDDESPKSSPRTRSFPSTKPAFESKVYDSAFELFQELDRRSFRRGKISGKILGLQRVRAAKCLLSGSLHEHENAYLIISEHYNKIVNPFDDEKPTIIGYTIRFGCHRNCNQSQKTLKIGTMNLDLKHKLTIEKEPKIEILKSDPGASFKGSRRKSASKKKRIPGIYDVI